MSSDKPNATWHPAFMPASGTDVLAKPVATTTTTTTTTTEAIATIPAAETAAAADESVATPTTNGPVTEGEAAHDVERDDATADAWFPEYDASSPWSEQPNHANADVSDVAIDPDNEADVEVHPASSSSASDTANKHMSTMSFARTVSNEVNWDAEDDDAEWGLTRADTDPFKFMPQSDRTNSFPIVPTLDATHTDEQPEQQVEHQLASNEAVDIIREVDQEVSQEVHADSGHVGVVTDSYSHAINDIGAAVSEEELGVRFEEGVPLILHDKHEATEEVSPPEHEADDPFGEGDNEEDDFFSHAGPPVHPEQTHASPRPAFERKSTMQVLQGMDVGTLGRENSDLAFAAEEELSSEAGAAGVPAQAPETKPEAEADAEATNGGSGTDLAAQWAAALGSDDEDELLMDDSVLETDTKEVDPAAFFGDDDEGFLDDDDVVDAFPVAQQPLQEVPVQPAAQVNGLQPHSTPSRYTPSGTSTGTGTQINQPQQVQQPPNPYLPSAAFSPAQVVVPSPYVTPGPAPSQFPISYGIDTGIPSAQRQQPQEPPAPKTQSFADKSKGGYHSPYDLPMDVVKPRKRQSMQHIPKAVEAVSAPPPGPPPALARSQSMQAFPSAPPTSFEHSQPPLQTPPVPASAPVHPPVHESFFEELPMIPKPRPASRHSQPSPIQSSPYGPPQTIPIHPPPQMTPHPFSHPPLQTHTPSFVPEPAHYSPAPTPASLHEQPAEQTTGNPDIAKLVAPPRLNPYSAPSNLAPQNASPSASMRYSPSPNQTLHANGTAHIPPTSRYSPAPIARVPSGGYAPIPAGVTPPMLPHQPRTSSPLAHFEMSYDKPRTASVGHPIMRGENHLPERRSSSSTYESRLNRVPSLPPTREVLEEDDSKLRPSTSGPPMQPPSQTIQYSPRRSRQTPPPPAVNPYGLSAQTLSPPKRILSYTPQNESIVGSVGSAPPGTLTQSPGSLFGNPVAPKPVDPAPIPAPLHDVAGTYHPMSQPATIPLPTRPRGASINLNLVPPTDGTEQDPLQRWKGAPVFAWGVGGTFVSSFPQDIPRYGINQALPMIHRAPGEVHVKNIKEIQPLEDRLARFPGPLRGKSKKKEVLAWLTAGIEDLAGSLPIQSFPLQISHEDKRLEERILLWKILRIFVEHDGVLEGTPAVDKAVRECLSPFVVDAPAAGELPVLTAGIGIGSLQDETASGHARSDAVDPAVIEQIRKNLLLGDRERAVWDAVDKRLWGHAFLIAQASSLDLFKKVAQEFVRKEVNTPGHSNESLAALYDVLSGNYEECVDELVPIHARAGLQLISTQPAAGEQSKDALSGLDKWRETLCLVLNNRTPDDVQAINSLGNLLSGYGRAEAAHVCFLFSRTVTVFGGLDDPVANFVLLGADHKRQADSFAKETDAVLLSEVYEYGLSLTGNAAAASGSPHLAAYKLQHAMTLAEYGFRDKALQYCETIMTAITAQTRRSPYHHVLLETAVDDLMKRLKQAPKEESNSWIPKPSMNKVSDTMWNRFNKFVAGDENEGAGTNSDGEGVAESGPFARLSGGTPTISRPPSSSGVTGMDMFGGHSSQFSPTFNMQSANGSTNSAIMSPPFGRTSSRYAPSAGGQSVTSPISISGPFESSGGYMPLSASAPTAAVPNPYEPTSAFATSGGRRSLDYQAPETSPRRASSELSPGYIGNGSYAPNTMPFQSSGHSDSGRDGLSRKSSYAPLSQAEPTRTASYEAPPMSNPYGLSQETSQFNGSPYASMAEQLSPTKQAKKPEPEVMADSGYQPMYGYEPPSFGSSFEAGPDGQADAAQSAQIAQPTQPTHEETDGGYDAPSFQPYSYEPPSYDADSGPAAETSNGNAELRPKKSFMDDDDDDIPALKQALKQPAEKTKEEKDRENAEMFRKAAEEDAKRAEAEKAAAGKKSWGLASWFGGGKKEVVEQAPKAVRANLGEKSSFYYDADLKRWVNKNGSPDDQAAKATPPPPPPRSVSQSSTTSAPPMSSLGMAPPPRLRPLGTSPSVPNLKSAMALGPGGPGGPGGAPPQLVRSASGVSLAASGPPSRPGTGYSEANSIDDLLGAPGPRKAGAKKGRKSGRYVDVMSK